MNFRRHTEADSAASVAGKAGVLAAESSALPVRAAAGSRRAGSPAATRGHVGCHGHVVVSSEGRDVVV